jgi:hypothetical protein
VRNQPIIKAVEMSPKGASKMPIRTGLLFLSLLALAAAQPKEIPVMPYDSLMSDRASVDGYVDVEEDEYPASFYDKASGLTVYWGFDDSAIYVALETKGKGWMAIGFGSPKMNESNMVIGYYSEDSAEVFNQAGAGYTHKDVAADSLNWDAEIDHDDEIGVTAMEFAYPLKWPKREGLAIPGLVAGDVYDLILAQNTKSISLTAAHTSKSALKFRMAASPRQQ